MFARRTRPLLPVKRLLLHCSLAVAALLLPITVLAADPKLNEEDVRREAAIAEFTAKMKAANYPALFEKAAAEFNVPADILKGVAFTLTRWEHLQWPPGENFSPEHGKPRPFGIMSLWSNDFFGMTLVEAAKLIGKDPDELKADPFQNMRGGAALLRKLYDANPKPEGTTPEDIESWRYAMAEYVGIPEPDLKHRFGLEVYEHMNKGYSQYGIEWKARPVKLGPMREEVKRIVAAEDAKREAFLRANPQLADGPIEPVTSPPPTLTVPEKAPAPEAPPPVQVATVPAGNGGIWWLVGVVLALLIGFLLLFRRKSRSKQTPKAR